MSKLSMSLFGGALMGAGMCSNAVANTVSFSGDIVVSNVNYTYANWSYGDTTIDTFCFSVAADGNVTFDALSYGIGPTWFDSEIFLFNDDGNPLGSSNFIAENDDWYAAYGSGSAADGNGSVNGHDSFMTVFLTAGDYKIAIGAFDTDYTEVESGMSGGYGYIRNSIGTDTGAYILDVTGDGITVNVVPLPPAAFAGLGMLAGLGAYRRVRK